MSSVPDSINTYLMSFHTDGNRLIVGNFNENGLNCNNWNEDANDNIGFFLLMV